MAFFKELLRLYLLCDGIYHYIVVVISLLIESNSKPIILLHMNTKQLNHIINYVHFF